MKKTTIKEIDKLLKQLRNKLKREYPDYHHEHLDIFSAYWTLRERIHNLK